MITCCFDCIDGVAAWTDERKEPLSGRVVHKRSGDEYGMLRDDNLEIRCKMAGLFFITPVIFAVRILLRLGHLFSGHWAIGQGYTRALKTWRLERYHAPIDEMGNKQQAPGFISLWIRVVLYSACYFADALSKCVTLPIAAMLSMSASFLAIADPLLARRCFAWVEEAWSLELERGSPLLLLNYSAPCMQPKRIWDQCDFYSTENKRNSLKDLYRSMLSIQYQLEDCKDYFPLKEYHDLSRHIKALREQIKKDINEQRVLENQELFYNKRREDLNQIRIAFETFAENLIILAEKGAATDQEKERNRNNLYQHLNFKPPS